MPRAPAADRPAAAFRACSDPTRLRILALLRGGEMCVGDLVTVLGVPQPSASRHLAYLRRAGLVAVRRDGLWCHYSLAPARTAFARKLRGCLGALRDLPDVRADADRAARLRREGGCCPP